MPALSKSLVRLFVASLASITASQAIAAPLASGSIATPNEAHGGSLVLPALASAFATPPGVGAFSGTLTTSVYQADGLNPLGGLTFVYKIDLVAGSAPIERLTLTDFTGYLTDVSYNGAGVASDTTTRTVTSTVGWNFFSGLGGGQSSAELIVQTNAGGLTFGQGNLIDGQVVSTAIYAPDGNIIPEPATLGLLGAAGLVALRRRK